MGPTEILLWIRVVVAVIELVRGHDEKTPRQMAEEIIPILPKDIQKYTGEALEEFSQDDLNSLRSIFDFLGEVLGKKDA